MLCIFNLFLNNVRHLQSLCNTFGVWCQMTEISWLILRNHSLHVLNVTSDLSAMLNFSCILLFHRFTFYRHTNTFNQHVTTFDFVNTYIKCGFYRAQLYFFVLYKGSLIFISKFICMHVFGNKCFEIYKQIWIIKETRYLIMQQKLYEAQMN